MRQPIPTKKLKTCCKTMLNRTALWMQLTIFMVLITTLVAGYLIYKDYTSTRNLTINNQISTTHKILSLELENLDNYLLDLANFCIQPYYASRFTRIVEQDVPLTAEQLSYAKQQMFYYYYTRNDILDYELYLIHQDLSIGRTNGQQHIITQEAAPEGVNKALLDCEKSNMNHSIKASDSATSLIYYHSLFQIKGKISQAIVRLKLDDTYAKQLLENHSEHGEIIVFLNDKEEIIFSNQAELPANQKAFLKALYDRQHQPEGYETVQLMEQPFLIVETDSKTTGIRLISLTPLSYIDSQIGKLRQSIIVSGIWVWLFTILLIYMLLRLFTIPLRVLTKQMQRTGEGDFHTRINVEGSTEIRGLSDNFNSMVSHIDQLIKRTYVAELSEKRRQAFCPGGPVKPTFPI